jgi:hypothetical protein
MPRIRTVKPEFFTSEVLSEASVRARLLFIGLFTHVDDAGRAVDNSGLIRAAIFPLDDFTLSDVDSDLAALDKLRLIIRYEVDGRRYLQIRNWEEHQKINRPSPSKLPPCPGISTQRDLTEDSLNTHGGVTEDSLAERKGMERKGIDDSSTNGLTARDANGQSSSTESDSSAQVAKVIELAVAGIAVRDGQDAKSLIPWKRGIVKNLREERTPEIVAALAEGKTEIQIAGIICKGETWVRKAMQSPNPGGYA